MFVVHPAFYADIVKHFVSVFLYVRCISFVGCTINNEHQTIKAIKLFHRIQ